MNTLTALVFVVLIVVYLIMLVFLVKLCFRRTNEKFERAICFFVLFCFLIFGVYTLVAMLNLYGVARLPLLNEVRSRLPETFTPVDKPVNPPVGGQMQAPSDQIFEQHKKQMEEIRKER